MAEFELAASVRDDDEGLFSRDINGHLVRLDAPTEKDYQTRVTLSIDGNKCTVPLATPLQDAQGNVVVDIDGQTTPRYTTIYDAVCQLDIEQPGKDLRGCIPRLCHQPHMTPVAVCRLCVVRIYGMKRGKRTSERKLLPACQHPVKEGMEVFTMNDAGPDGKIVREAVSVLAELLVADNLKPVLVPELEGELEPFNELKQLASRCGVEKSRFKSELLNSATGTEVDSGSTGRETDLSSPVFIVDHSACILCDRCSRACNEVNKNNVIGRTGKGTTAAIGFDLNDPMGESSCVQCGECMISCPTSAIIFRRVKQVEIPQKKK